MENRQTQTKTVLSMATLARAIRDFKDLEVWNTARELRHELYRMSRGFPAIETFGLASQIRRAADLACQTEGLDSGETSRHPV